MSEDTDALLRELYRDPVLLARTLLPHWFPRKMPWVHRGILALALQRTDFLTNFGEENWRDEVAVWTEADVADLVENFVYQVNPDDPQSQRIKLFSFDGTAVHLATSNRLQVMLPRGLSKTTLFNFITLFNILFKLVRFMVYVSETATHAEQQLANVKRELESNTALIDLFGTLQPDKSDPERWSSDFIETLTGVAVQCKGRGGQVRGLNVGGARPEIILLDDVEDKESVATDTQRRKTLSWLWGDVIPALPQHEGAGGRLFVLGTMLHSEAMMMALARDPEVITIRFGAMLDSGKALWPYYMKEKSWLAKREQYKRMGLLSEFYMEYQSSLHVDADSRKFKIEDWRTTVMTRADFELLAMAIDPAISEKSGADSCVIAVAGMTTRGFIHLLDMASGKGWHPRQQVDEFFRLHFLWNPNRHGVESIAYQAALVHLIREEQFRQSKIYGNRAYFGIVPITHSSRKVERIEGILAPRYAAGYVTHQRRFAELESEAIDWPHGKKDHLDALAMAVGLLDPAAAFAGPEATITLPAREWEVLAETHASQCP